MVTDHPTPEALAARLRELAESGLLMHGDRHRLEQAADLLEAQQRQLAALRAVAEAACLIRLGITDASGKFLLYQTRGYTELQEALAAARAAGALEGKP